MILCVPQVKCVQLLLRAGADPFVYTTGQHFGIPAGSTPLWMAEFHHHVQLKVMLSQGTALYVDASHSAAGERCEEGDLEQSQRGARKGTVDELEAETEAVETGAVQEGEVCREEREVGRCTGFHCFVLRCPG